MLLLIQIAIIAAFGAAALTLALKHIPTISKFCAFILLGISGATATASGILALLKPSNIIYQIRTGFPELILEFKLDPLSGFFLAIVGIIVFCMAIYGPGYLRSFVKHKANIKINFFTSIFVASMYLLLFASDVFSFMFAWELMSVSSYFLVAHHDEQAANRSAALIYLIMAHLSGLLILFCYGILVKFSDGYSFSTLSTASLTPAWTSIAFLLGLLGFGMKAGIVPLHVWLPRAHPVAPSHISALMSGVMLKVAIYGLLRLSFCLLQKIYWQFGIIILIIGIISALLGILYAILQTDLKKLLAYSSVENVGIILIGIGLSIIFVSTNHPMLGALGLIAALYHSLNHALFKSLLFFGAGALLQRTHEHDLEKMGGIIHKMPYTALFFLIGCISISALPFGNGFVSEWLTFQTALQASALTSEILRIIIPLAAAALALTGALAAACFVKVYGIAFLGSPRTQHVRLCNDPSFGMRTSMGILAALCLLFGLLPTLAINVINNIPQYLFGTKLAITNNWFWLYPIATQNASFNALAIFGFAAGLILFGYVLRYLFSRRSKTSSGKLWDCGFGGINSRMQYSATAFAMPIRRVFKGTSQVIEDITKENSLINYKLQINDWVWKFIYAPLATITATIARQFARIQGGNVRIYLSYTFATLILLLWIIA